VHDTPIRWLAKLVDQSSPVSACSTRRSRATGAAQATGRYRGRRECKAGMLVLSTHTRSPGPDRDRERQQSATTTHSSRSAARTSMSSRHHRYKDQHLTFVLPAARAFAGHRRRPIVLNPERHGAGRSPVLGSRNIHGRRPSSRRHHSRCRRCDVGVNLRLVSDEAIRLTGCSGVRATR
jgi:hypothetical protein